MNAGSDRSEMIREIVTKLVEGYAPVRIVLFGSHARGEADAESDIDLLIIKDTEAPPRQRWSEVKRLLRDHARSVAVSPLVYTPAEIEGRLRINDFFVREALSSGEVLYG